MPHEVTIAARYTVNETGESGYITAEQIEEALTNSGGALVLDEYYSTVNVLARGIVEIDLHPDTEFMESDAIPLQNTKSGILPGRYFVVYGETARMAGFGDEAGQIADSALRGLILATDENQLYANPDTTDTERLELEAVTLTPNGNIEDIESRGEPIELWAIRNSGTGEFIQLHDVLGGLAAIAALKLALDFYGIGGEEKAGPLTIKTGKLFAGSMRGKPNRTDGYGDTGAGYLANLGTLQITAESEKALETALASNKTLIQLNALATASNYKYDQNRTLRVTTTLDDMLEQRGITLDGMAKSTKSKTRRKVKEEVLSLAGVSWNFVDENGDFVRIPLAGGTCSVTRGKVSFVFSSEFMGAVLNRGAGRLALDPALLRTDDKRNPHAMPIGYKLASHSYQNIGKPNECTLSVESLLDFVNGIPAYEQVKESDRAYTRRIIEPMERDLTHLVEIGFLKWWDYCHAKGEPLTDAEQDARITDGGEEGVLPYDIAITANIQWELAETYDEQRAETVKSRERRAELAEAAKQRNAERQKRIDRKIENNIAKKAAEKAMGE